MEVKDILELVTKKFELLDNRIEEITESLEKTLKELQARRELEEDQIAELDRLTQRTSTQLKVLIQLAEKLERQS